jgi:hypothetical protein
MGVFLNSQGGNEEMKMHTLVIHAPKSKCKPELKNCFEDYFKTGVGLGYIAKCASKLPSGSTVVLIDRDQRLCAKGILVEPLIPTVKTPQQHYNVHFDRRVMVDYADYEKVKLNHYGVAVLDC